MPRKDRYAGATKPLENLARQVRRCTACAGDDQKDHQFEAALNSVSEIFSGITGTPTRACVKLVDPSEPPFVFVFARDESSAETSRTSDRLRAEAHHDTLAGNPHISDLILKTEGEDYFFVEDIPEATKNEEFISTSASWKKAHPDLFPAGSGIGYKSALMALIRSANGTPLGFLGIDSPTERAFQPGLDGPLLVAVAQLLSPALETVHKRSIVSNEESDLGASNG